MSTTPSSATLALILDVDDTLAKEVSITEHRSHPNVQLLRYAPGEHAASRYRRRLDEEGSGAHSKDKVVHYEFQSDGATMVSAVVVRPGIAALVDHLRSVGAELLLASANDAARTVAVCEQLRLTEADGAPTLAELGFRVVPRDLLIPRRGAKDIAAVRAWAGLNDLCLGIVVDDKPEELVGTSGCDHVVAAPAFGRAEADSLLLAGSGETADDTSATAAPTSSAGATTSCLDSAAEREMVERVKAATHSLPKLGVSMAFLHAFLESSCQGKLDLATATTDEVCEAVVKPALLAEDLPASLASTSFATLVQEGRVPNLDPSTVGRATHFVSHAWGYRFIDVVDALGVDSKDAEATGTDGGNEIFFWLDLFVVPQTISVTPPHAWWATAFFHAIATQRVFVIVCFQWDKPKCFRRAWCLWELYAAHRMGKKIEEGTLRLALPQDQREAFRACILQDVHSVQKSILRVDAAMADARNPDDKAMIFAAIETHDFGDDLTSFDGLNATIKRLLQVWVKVCGVHLCDEGGIPDVEVASLRHAVALLAHQRADYQTAEHQFRLAVGARERNLGRNNEETLESMHRLAGSLIKKEATQPPHSEPPSLSAAVSSSSSSSSAAAAATSLPLRPQKLDSFEGGGGEGAMEEAMELLQHIRDVSNAPESMKLRAQKLQSEVLMRSGDLAEAVRELRGCLKNPSMVPFQGAGRAEQLSVKNGGLRQLFHCEKLLGTALREFAASGESGAEHLNAEALALHEGVARDWGTLDGETHDNCLAAQTQLALSLHACGRTDEAVDMLSYVVRVRTREDGRRHRKTMTALNNLNALNEKQIECARRSDTAEAGDASSSSSSAAAAAASSSEDAPRAAKRAKV